MSQNLDNVGEEDRNKALRLDEEVSELYRISSCVCFHVGMNDGREYMLWLMTCVNVAAVSNIQCFARLARLREGCCRDNGRIIGFACSLTRQITE